MINHYYILGTNTIAKAHRYVMMETKNCEYSAEKYNLYLKVDRKFNIYCNLK
jgi:hypothetical protein